MARGTDAAEVGFDDQLIYDELPLPISERRIPTQQALRNEGVDVFKAWAKLADKVRY